MLEAKLWFRVPASDRKCAHCDDVVLSPSKAFAAGAAIEKLNPLLSSIWTWQTAESVPRVAWSQIVLANKRQCGEGPTAAAVVRHGRNQAHARVGAI